MLLTCAGSAVKSHMAGKLQGNCTYLAAIFKELFDPRSEIPSCEIPATRASHSDCPLAWCTSCYQQQHLPLLFFPLSSASFPWPALIPLRHLSLHPGYQMRRRDSKLPWPPSARHPKGTFSWQALWTPCRWRCVLPAGPAPKQGPAKAGVKPLAPPSADTS